MLGIPVRYLLRHPLTVGELLAEPRQTLSTIKDAYLAHREFSRPKCPYQWSVAWDQSLHAQIGVRWPCPATGDFQTLWARVVGELETLGIRPGPESFASWNDGDAGFVRALWCLTRHLQPSVVVETGVAHGFSSRFILEALEQNGSGHLWSIDLPPVEHALRQQVGIAVGSHQRSRWSYVRGSSRRRLPDLIRRLPQIDLFIHDSLHSERNVRFELDSSWAVLGPGGAIVVDDVDANWGFHSFTNAFSGQWSVVCEAEPLRPDKRRFNQKGLFGIILKEPTRTKIAA